MSTPRQEIAMSHSEPASVLSQRLRTDRAGLSQDEEHRLAQLAQRGDERAFERLVKSHVPLVCAIASEFRSYGLPAEELLSEGLLGLVKATRCFDHERGSRLATYAAWWIRAYIRQYTLDNRRIVRGPSRRSSRKVLAGLSKTERALTQVRGERPEPQALARALGVTTRDVEEIRSALGARDVAYGVEVAGRSFELPSDWSTPEAIVSDAQERQAATDRLHDALCQLDPRARRILEQRHLAPEVATLGMLSDELGVSRERVRQIEASAKARLRALCA
jgi:RNA polymerase sigma-32 factor